MAVSKSESDVILNRANVALARSQRLVASWLPAQTETELANTKSEEELQREEDEIFTAVPETLGVGAPLPERAADGSWKRTELSSNDKLRKQLLGRNYDKVMKAAAAANNVSTGKGGATSAQGGKTTALAGRAGRDEGSDDDEEEGRSAMVGKKKRMGNSGNTQPVVAAEDNAAVDQVEVGDESGSAKDMPAKSAPSKGRKKATSYLDELLAERSKKRRKR